MEKNTRKKKLDFGYSSFSDLPIDSEFQKEIFSGLNYSSAYFYNNFGRIRNDEFSSIHIILTYTDSPTIRIEEITQSPLAKSLGLSVYEIDSNDIEELKKDFYGKLYLLFKDVIDRLVTKLTVYDLNEKEYEDFLLKMKNLLNDNPERIIRNYPAQ